MQDAQDFQDFLNHLTDNALASLKHADGIARAAGSAYVGTEHLLMGVLAQETSQGAKLLKQSGVTLDKTRLAMNLGPKNMTLNMGAKGLSLCEASLGATEKSLLLIAGILKKTNELAD